MSTTPIPVRAYQLHNQDGLSRSQWLRVAMAALQNATGFSPSHIDQMLDAEGIDFRATEETRTPTIADWQHAYNCGGHRIVDANGEPL